MIQKHTTTMLWMAVAASISPWMAHAAEKETKTADVSYVTPDAVAAIVIHPARILTAVKAEQLSTEFVTASGKQQIGIDPTQVEQVLGIVEIVEGEPRWGAVLRFTKPVDQQKLLPEIMAKAPEDAALLFTNDQTLILAHESVLKRISENLSTPKEGTMSTVLKHSAPWPDAMAIVQITPIRPLLAKQLHMAPIPAGLEEAKKLPDLVTSIEIKASASGNMPMELSIKANSESDAEQVERILLMLLEAAKEQAGVEIAKKQVGGEPNEKDMIETQKQVTEKVLDSLRPARQGTVVTVKANLYKNFGVIGIPQ